MNATTRFSAQRVFFSMIAGMAVLGAILLAGCSSSSESTMEGEATVIDSLQTSIDALLAENAALSAQVKRLDQDKKN